MKPKIFTEAQEVLCGGPVSPAWWPWLISLASSSSPLPVTTQSLAGFISSLSAHQSASCLGAVHLLFPLHRICFLWVITLCFILTIRDQLKCPQKIPQTTLSNMVLYFYTLDLLLDSQSDRLLTSSLCLSFIIFITFISYFQNIILCV